MQDIPHNPKSQVKNDITVFTNTHQMYEGNKREGMYEALQIRLDKTYLEVQKIIAAL
jgi:hypothetical protein